jgi:hypothetical protein
LGGVNLGFGIRSATTPGYGIGVVLGRPGERDTDSMVLGIESERRNCSRSTRGHARCAPRRTRFIAAGLAVVLAGACGSSSVDAQRLSVLSNDPLALAQAPDTTPWLPAVPTPEHIQAWGVVGSGDGIGFGGITSTNFFIIRHVQGPPRAALRYYASTAIRAGWRIHVTCNTRFDVFTADKQFPGWVATAFVSSDPFKGAPAVQISIETDWHGRTGTPKVLSPLAGGPLTVEGLARTCLVAST